MGNSGGVFVIVNAALYIISFIICFRRSKSFNLGCLLLSLYAVAVSCSCYVYFNSNALGAPEIYQMTFFPFLYLFIMLMLFSRPILKFPIERVARISPPNSLVLYLLSYSILFISLFAIVGMMPRLITSISSYGGDISFISDSYMDSMESSIESSARSGGINFIAVLASQFSEISLFLMFYLLTLAKKRKMLIIGLGFSSLIPSISGFFLGYRSFMMTFFLSVIFLLALFKNSLRPEIFRKFKRMLAVVLIFVLVGIVLISISRFGNTGRFNSDVLLSLMNYGGQSFINFDEYVFKAKALQYGDNNFPVFRMMMGLDYSKGVKDRQENWVSKTEIPAHVFYTFIGDLCLDFGPVLVFFIALIIPAIVNKMIRFAEPFPLHRLLLLFFLCNVCAQGVFYFMYKTIGGNLKILAYVFVYFVFLLTSKKESSNG